MTIWIISFIFILAVAAYFRASLMLWSVLLGFAVTAFHFFSDAGLYTQTIVWSCYLALVVPLNIRPLRRQFLGSPIYKAMAGVMPTISQTEQEALDAGDVWWEAELFSGKPDFDVVRQLPPPKLTEEEQAFLDGPVEQLCEMVDDWKITHPPVTKNFCIWLECMTLRLVSSHT